MRQDLTTLDIGQILLSDMFGLPSLRSPVWDSKIRRRNELLAKGQLTDEETASLEELNRELSVLKNGETPNAIASHRLLQEIALKLGIEL